MRYIRKQVTTQIIADENIEDLNVIKDLLQVFYAARTDLSLNYRKDELSIPVSHERARIISVHDDSFDITVIGNAHSMIVRKIPINSIEYLSTTISPAEIFIKKDSIKKGDTLDIS